jgi:hypothetical protein
VQEYRTHFARSDGHFDGCEPIVCARDAAAIAKAKRLGIEFLSGTRLVVRLEPSDNPETFSRPTHA